MHNVATPKQLSKSEQLRKVERDKATSIEDGNAQPSKPVPFLLCTISSSSVAPQLWVKHHIEFSIFSREIDQRITFYLVSGCLRKEVNCKVIQRHIEAEDRVLIIGTTVDLVPYLDTHASPFQMIEKFKLMYGTITSFNILMQNLYRLQLSRKERVPAYITQLEGILNAV